MIYEVSRGNPWMRSSQNVYFRPLFRRILTPNLRAIESSFVAPPIVPITIVEETKFSNVGIGDNDSIEHIHDNEKGKDDVVIEGDFDEGIDNREKGEVEAVID
ncbi:unnamed protein product [Acanthoscelides obtectus]|uniref:Uncharacterized protein n=1 Tax=Acanthoscelides obtectus TaxID=200917 RepID=A0A9P0K2M0_ACAOB|nr:unnamed protein product [Acanthoscelides obtectus]CAK1669708.1 hypothetical protein AOBTE_LOCUS27192 [Acanthoscelides obtectus]